MAAPANAGPRLQEAFGRQAGFGSPNPRGHGLARRLEWFLNHRPFSDPEPDRPPY